MRLLTITPLTAYRTRLRPRTTTPSALSRRRNAGLRPPSPPPPSSMASSSSMTTMTITPRSSLRHTTHLSCHRSTTSTRSRSTPAQAPCPPLSLLTVAAQIPAAEEPEQQQPLTSWKPRQPHNSRGWHRDPRQPPPLPLAPPTSTPTTTITSTMTTTTTATTTTTTSSSPTPSMTPSRTRTAGRPCKRCWHSPRLHRRQRTTPRASAPAADRRGAVDADANVNADAGASVSSSLCRRRRPGAPRLGPVMMILMMMMMFKMLMLMWRSGGGGAILATGWRTRHRRRMVPVMIG